MEDTILKSFTTPYLHRQVTRVNTVTAAGTGTLELARELYSKADTMPVMAISKQPGFFVTVSMRLTVQQKMYIHFYLQIILNETAH